MDIDKYNVFVQERQAEIREQEEVARKKAAAAYNKGLWDSVKGINPLAYLILKRDR